MGDTPVSKEEGGVFPAFDLKVLLPLVNIVIAVIGFVSVYAVTTTKLQDAAAASSQEILTLRSEILELHRRAQTITDALVNDRILTSNRLITIETDVKYITKAVDGIATTNAVRRR